MKKKLLMTLAGLCVVSSAFNQDCTTDPSKFSGHVVSGQFAFMGGSDDEYNDVVMLRDEGSIMYIDVLKGDVFDNRVLEKNVNSFTYDLDNVNGRMVSGDFDHDGFINDFALIYKAGASTMRIDVFKSDNAYFPTFTKSTYLTLTGYDPDKVTGRVVSGDFDRDGRWDDIAMFYDYGGGETRIHVFTSTGASFSYSGGSSGWWSATGYTAGQFTDRVVSGDFDRDGKEDDIAVFYDYGGGQTRIHVFQSTGSSFSYSGPSGWWSSYGYTASSITGRVVSVNINRNNKIFDDIAVFYDYGGGLTRMHVFESDGSSFSYAGGLGWWSSYGYTAANITNKVVAIDTRSGVSGGKISDVLAFYNYGTATSKYHIWRAYDPLFGSPYVEYSHHNFCDAKAVETDDSEKEHTSILNENIKIEGYPNPTNGIITLTINGTEEENVSVEVYSITGVLIHQEIATTKSVRLDLEAQPAGIYVVNVKSSTESKQIKIIKE